MHINNEFQILAYLGEDLPGALVAKAMEPEEVPGHMLTIHGKAKAVKFKGSDKENKFSLAGVQMKFSMKEKDGCYTGCKAL